MVALMKACSSHKPACSCGFEWPLYQGGLVRNRMRLAESRRSEAEDALEAQSSAALREVALAYDQVQTGLSQYDAAAALQSAAQTSYDSASDAFAQWRRVFFRRGERGNGFGRVARDDGEGACASAYQCGWLGLCGGELTSSAAPGIRKGSKQAVLF